MFAKMLIEEEKKSFLTLLEYLSLIDGVVTAEEEMFLLNVANEVGIEFIRNNDLLNQHDLVSILNTFKSNLSKNIILIELVNMANADHKYSQSEKDGILKISEILQISKNKLSEIENWVHDGLLWKDKGLTILNN